MKRLVSALVAVVAVFTLASAPADAELDWFPEKLVVHNAPKDTNGDGGYWAWSFGGYQPVVHASAPSKAARVLNSLEVGEYIQFNSSVIPSGRYVIVSEGGRAVPGAHDLAIKVDGRVLIADVVWLGRSDRPNR